VLARGEKCRFRARQQVVAVCWQIQKTQGKSSQTSALLTQWIALQ